MDCSSSLVSSNVPYDIDDYPYHDLFTSENLANLGCDVCKIAVDKSIT